MIEQWQYFLVVPESSVAAANLVTGNLGNPSGIRPTFAKWPVDGGDIDSPIITAAQYWIASFLATDTAAEGNPSREALEGYPGQHTALAALLWVRCKNPHHPNTPENEKGIVVASNWAAFPVGGAVSWALVSEAVAAL